MASRGAHPTIKQIKQIFFFTLTLISFVGLCSASLTQGEDDSAETADVEMKAVASTDIMRGLIAPAKKHSLKCALPESTPPLKRCMPFFNIDETTLTNLVHNYPNCLEGHSFYINFSTQPPVVINKPLKIYGRTEEPFTITGLSLRPSKKFPKGSPAVIVYGKEIILKTPDIKGFKNAVFYNSDDNQTQKIIGGRLSTEKSDNPAIISCDTPPDIAGIEISGYNEDLLVIDY